MGNEETRDVRREMVVCPHCDEPLPEYDGGEFCSECGQALRRADGSLPTPPPLPELENVSDLPEPGAPTIHHQDDPVGDEETMNVATKPPDFQRSTSAEETARPQAPQASRPEGKRKKNQCTDLEVRYNVSRVFVDGVVMSFDLLITPLVEDLSEICVDVHVRDARHRDYHDRQCVMEIPEKDEELEVSINFLPPSGMHGRISFTFYVTYRKDDDVRWFLAHQKHWIFPPHEKARVAIDRLQIDLSTKIIQGDVADATVNQRLDSLKDLADAITEKNDTAEWLATIDLPEVWESLPLRRCRPPTGDGGLPPRPTRPTLSPPQPGQAARCRQLTLQNAHERVQLVAGDRNQFGRNRKNTLVIRRAEVLRNQEEHSRISRFHFRLERRSNEVWIVDRASAGGGRPARASAYGTYIDESRIAPGKEARIFPSRTHRIGLAGGSDGDPDAMLLEMTLYTCGASELSGSEYPESVDPSEPACLFIRRKDNIPEFYLVVWRYARLSLINSKQPPGWIWRSQDAFAWRDGDDCLWLEPGVTCTAGTATAFSQWGLEKQQNDE